MIAYYLTPIILTIISIYLLVYFKKNYIIMGEEAIRPRGHAGAHSMDDEEESSGQDADVAKRGLPVTGDTVVPAADGDALAPVGGELVSLGTGDVAIIQGRDGAFDNEWPEEVDLFQGPLLREGAVIDPDVLLAALIEKLASDEHQYKDGNNSFVDKPYARFEYKRVEFKVRDGR